ncbi:MAG: PEP-CTERM sorting domain-containing protein [Deltaproteobacteria bacterium]|nr:PEP-CTERM sorting domain-containing protein [Deltaproteobacteria bacterium]
MAGAASGGVLELQASEFGLTWLLPDPGVGPPAGNGFFTLALVPEPTTALLMAAAVLGLAAHRRRLN